MRKRKSSQREHTQAWAPKAKLVVGKVLDKDGNGDVSHVMKGIEWILKERKKYGIRIVNISVGTNPGLAKKTKRTAA